MAYVALATVNAGDPIESAAWGNVVKNNLDYLLSRPKSAVFRDNAAAYTTTSTSFVDIDGTNLKCTISISGSAVLVGFTGMVINTAGGASVVCLDLAVDGTRLGAAGGEGLGAKVQNGTITPVKESITLLALATGLSTGSHSFTVQWKTNAGTASLSSGVAGSDTDYIPHIWAVEVG
jgi:hypothetical protein